MANTIDKAIENLENLDQIKSVKKVDNEDAEDLLDTVENATHSLHEPEWDSLEPEAEWDAPNLEDFGEDPDLGGVDDHFLLSSTGFPPENFGDLDLPVVTPDGALNLNALANAKARVSQVEGLSSDKEQQVVNMINSLADEHFPESDFTENSVYEQVKNAFRDFFSFSSNNTKTDFESTMEENSNMEEETEAAEAEAVENAEQETAEKNKEAVSGSEQDLPDETVEIVEKLSKFDSEKLENVTNSLDALSEIGSAEDIKEALKETHNEYKEQKDKLVGELVENEECVFEEEELRNKSIDFLRKLNRSCSDTVYSGQAGFASHTTNSSEDQEVPKPPSTKSLDRLEKEGKINQQEK